MLMARNEGRGLQPIREAISEHDYERICRRALEVAASFDAHASYAECVSGVTPRWYVVKVVPGMEAEARAELVRRRFGVYDPMFDEVYTCRGRKRTKRARVLPGYLLVFCWDAARHRDRILACAGVTGLLSASGRDEPVAMPDGFVDALYREEVIKAFDILAPRAKRKRKRRYERRVFAAKSYLEDGESEALATDERIGLLRTALGLGS